MASVHASGAWRGRLGFGICGFGVSLVYSHASTSGPAVVEGMRAVYLLLPVGFYLAALPFLRGYAISGERHAAIIRELDDRHA